MDRLKLNNNMLKIIAAVCMVIDHAPDMFPGVRLVYVEFPFSIIHFIGRISAPLFFYAVAFGFIHTRDRLKYAVRLLIFALISYFPWMFYFNESWSNLNIIFLMFLGVVFLSAVDRKPIFQNKTLDLCARIIMFAGVFLCAPYAEYQHYGLVLIVIFYLTMDHKITMAVLAFAAMATDVLYTMLSTVMGSVEIGFLDALNFMFHNTYSINFMLMSSGVFLTIPLLLLKDRNDFERPSKFSKYFFYVFYPAHLSVFLLVSMVIKSRS